MLIEHGKSEGLHVFELQATPEGAKVYEQAGFTLHPQPTYRLILE